MLERPQRTARGQRPGARRRRHIGAAVALCLGAASPAALAQVEAATQARFTTEHVAATLATEFDAVVPGATITALLTLDIIDGWHTYWKNPGDSGEATRIDWTLPEGVTAGEIRWPTPHRIPYSGFINYGYEGVAHHLVTLTVSDTVATGRTLPLSASATWLVCEDICIPETGTFELVVRTTDRLVPGSTSSPAFAAARAQLPSEAGPVSARRDGADAVFDLTGLPPLVDVYFFPDDWGVVEPGATQTLNDGTLRLAGATLGDAPVSGVLTGLTADDRRVGLSISASLGATTAAPTAAPAADIGLPTALLFALLGGVILNLMPCVFPVLSMKAMHLVNSDDAQSARTDGLAYTAGVLVFFAVLGIALLALRASGDAIGWGFQLQSPPVVGALALLMFLIGLNLMGAFDIGGAFMGAGSSLAGRGGAVGAFFTGALAAIVATPCTAPFMGVALGFALTQPAPVALTVLLTLGLGLALPFLVVALVPALAARLPRPGAWMNTLRQALAFPMFGAAVWLAWVLALQTGPDGVLRLLSAAVIAALAVWLWPRRRHHVAAALCAAAAAACLVAVGTLQPGATGTALTDDTQKRGVAFSPERLSAARAAGDTVFVNQTAAWCLTCLVNEKNVLSTSRVESALRAPGVTYMSGDWTRRDPDITAFLSEHGRSGVPLYVVYHGNAPGVVLPPVLTESIVLDALERPAGTAQISNGARLSATLRQPKLRQP